MMRSMNPGRGVRPSLRPSRPASVCNIAPAFEHHAREIVDDVRAVVGPGPDDELLFHGGGAEVNSIQLTGERGDGHP